MVQDGFQQPTKDKTILSILMVDVISNTRLPANEDGFQQSAIGRDILIISLWMLSSSSG